MKTYIYSSHFNIPEYIELQYNSIKKYFTNDFEYIIINDAKDYGDLTNFNQKDLEIKINNICNKYNINVIRFPQNNHKDRKILFPNTIEPNTENAVTRCADVTQYLINDFIEKKYDGYLMILDADMFFIKEFDIIKYMKNYNLAGIKQRMGYLWNGICIFNSKEIPLNELNFDCGYVNNEPVDVGGQTYHFMVKYKDIIKYKPITCSHYTYPYTLPEDNIKNLLLQFCELREDKSANKEIILDKTIIHLRNGGNWEYKTKDFKYKELFILSSL